ncbi:MAG: hypothetical protein LZF60_80193 [Nitrospira sp.]|nr:MAG: hypothetical protein LZF60_80193 [Nitrospira sp.]
MQRFASVPGRSDFCSLNEAAVFNEIECVTNTEGTMVLQG